ncbi:MAG: NAD(P)H-binding protein [Rhodospirillaceae bacterium]|nr:NAD(P)H-binding protein [Rhodospirillaceae bacterium]
MKKSLLSLVAMAALLGFAAPAPAQDIKPGGVMVAGGAGLLGSDIVKLLLAKGETVSVFVRPETDRAKLAGLAVHVTEGDAMKAADVEAAVMKAKPRAVINAIGGRGNTVGFWDTTQKNITAAAKQAGVKELIFFSSVGVGDSAKAYPPEDLARAREAMLERERAEDDLKASGLTYVIIRTGGLSWHGEPPTGNGTLTEDRGVLGMIKYADLARLTVNCIGNAACANKTWASVDPNLKRPEGR